MQPFDQVERLEGAAALDRVSQPLARAVRALIRPRPLGNFLHGVPIGHPLHPALILAPAGAWISASVLDLVPGTGPAVPALIGVGLVSAVPTAAAGLADWSEMRPEQQRVGLVHAGLNLLATGLYGASLLARVRGGGGSGKGLSFAGLGVLGISGYLGGHLSYRQSGGANHAEDVPYLVEPGWHDIGSLDDLPEGAPVRRLLGDVALFVLRRGEAVHVLADRCTHLSGPLHQGRLTRDDDGRECITCPWHGSTFRVDDGSVWSGPATSPEPVFEARVAGRRVSVRRPEVG